MAAPGGVSGRARDVGRGARLSRSPRPADEAGIAAAVEALSRGKLVLHPTETVVSLTGDPHDDRPVEAARRLKGYGEHRPFLCLVAGAEGARRLAREWPAPAEVLAAAFWPGPLTLVLAAAAAAPRAVSGSGTIALRPGADPVSIALLAAWGGPLFSTSANARGDAPPTDVVRALAGLAEVGGPEAIEVALTPLDPAPPAGRPSTIVDVSVSPPRLVREGAIPGGRLRDLLPDLVGGES